jgi:DeoR family transcriptional regulator of aga operon
VQVAKRTEDRSRQVLHLLLQHGDTSIEALASLVQASPASVRRDLIALEKRSLVQRRHGSVDLAGEMKFSPFRFDSAFALREDRFADEKRRIAAAAATLVQDGDVLAIGPGTTTTLLGRNLRHRERLQIVTSAMNIGIELSAHANLSVTLTGGTSRWSGSFSLVGNTAFHALQRLSFDRVFLSGTAVDASRGLSVIESDEALILGEMVRRGRQLIVIADSSKLGMTGANTVCETSQIHTLITDKDASPNEIAAFRERGVHTITA